MGEYKDPWNNGREDYGTRFFNTRTGDVALTCCKRCGDIIWNTALHERTHHADEQDTATEEGTDSQESTGENQGGTTEVGELSTPVSVGGGDAAAGRPQQRGVGAGTGRATAAGSGKRQGR